MALAFPGGELSYRDLDAAAAALASRLEGVARQAGRPDLAGRRVAVVAPNVPALVVAMLASWRVGAVCVPLSARLREFDLRNVLDDADLAAIVSVGAYRDFSFQELLPELLGELPTLCGCVFVDDLGRAVVERLRPGRAAPGDRLDASIAAILYTSGTTGAPKGALITHACLANEAAQLAPPLRLSKADATALVIPGSHAFGLACLLAALRSRGTTVLVDSSFSLEPLIDAIESRAATVLHGSPALFVGLRAVRPGGLAGVRTGYVAGAACPSGLIEAMESTGMELLNLFGMTELGAACSCRPDDPPAIRHETVGRPLPGYELRTVPGPEWEPDIGELQVRGPFVTPGYFRQPARTKEAFDGDWFRTGDLASIDDQGCVRISGRMKELVHVGGFNVFPAEVENLLLTHPDVAQVAVVGVPHERLGEALAAYAVARPGSAPTPSELLRFARGRIAGYKLPYRIELLPDLPLLPSGKPDRAALRERARASLPEPAGAPHA